ncbi:MAG: hypothetical protein ACFUZC_11175 [Chthoniobacteraceae bacterium]
MTRTYPVNYRWHGGYSLTGSAFLENMPLDPRISLLGRSERGCLRSALLGLLLLVASTLYGAGSDKCALQNAHLRVTVDANTGRIVEFGRVDGPNLLWINDAASLESEYRKTGWKNRGGDRFHPAPQALWRFASGENLPPDAAMDGDSWRIVECTSRRFVMESRKSALYSVRARWTLILDGPRLVIYNRLTRTASNPFPVHLWSVTQVPRARAFLLESRAVNPRGGCFTELWGNPARDPQAVTISGRVVRFIPPNKRPTKVGALGGWLAAVYGQDVFLQTTSYQPGGCYPEGSSVQVFDDGRRYVELETLSELRHLRAGESLCNTVVWSVVPLWKFQQRIR